MSLSEFQKRLKEAQKGGDRISKLVEEEAALKQQLLEEAATQAQRLKDLGDDFDDLKKGSQLGPAS